MSVFSGEVQKSNSFRYLWGWLWIGCKAVLFLFKKQEQISILKNCDMIDYYF
ncbi:hypothetical protein LEP1GSC008_1743 [Leptospira kirschneri serovar Bulgarica str. Nikolaevo]|uniref:Uncharacterized protein n=1 Tax=Leptospira kirschneri serovar Bulgarica str. Nikolaevo TaxID=1240687 RepID=M6FGD8_9LEPT|nr:hypothetical protein LEP1GSC008_1743 [Leptospira kirschneri serovar Bulgarica str. Nikolaevo]